MPVPDIEFIEKWITEGCLEDLWPPAGPEAALEDEGDSQQHIAYWREFDNRTLFNPTAEVQAAIEAIMPRMGVWRRFVKGQISEADWEAVLPPLASHITRLHEVQRETVESFYGSPVQRPSFFESYQDFGANTLPDDPLRPQDPRHTMNGSTMWFIWSAFADACLRSNLASDFLDVQIRGILIGAANDGLFRGRFAVQGFPATPEGQAQIISRFSELASADLPGELAQRYLDTGL